jgi:hypothetical protein
MSLFKNIIQKEIADTRSFHYSKNKCNLDFNLRIDVRTELKDFKDLLLRAIEDIEEELKNEK